MFESLFIAELKRLKLKRYDVCSLLKCTMPTLKSRVKDPLTLTIKEALKLKQNGFRLDGILDDIIDVGIVEFPKTQNKN